jgi:UDP-N-acetylmuramoyl-L-alanyl-D-glutamate--2,6-diaminopimelate ligase
MHADLTAGQRIRLRQVLPDAEFVGADDLDVRSCTCDCRMLEPGDLFAAVRGSHYDGHEFAAEAAARGAAAIIAERPVEVVGVPCCYVADSRAAYARICQALAGDPSRRLRVIGVTGTNGKTTTSWLIASILAEAGYRAGVMGTLGCYDGQQWHPASMTTPPPERLARLLARMVASDCSHAVMEVSSHALDQSRVAGMQFDAACVTNVRHDHLDYHGTLTAYRAAKAKLFRYLTPEGFAVINADDAGAAHYLGQLDGPVLTVGIDQAAEITAVPIEQFLAEQTFLLVAGSETIPVRTRMIGRHHIHNCLVAAAVGLVYGIDLPTIVRGLEGVRRVPGRLERLECGQPFGVFVDYAHTPDALAVTLQTLRELTTGRVICVFGAGGDRDRQKRPQMGRQVESYAHLAVLTNDNPRNEDPRAIMDDVLTGFRDPQCVEVIPDRTAAIRFALAQARPGDCVLLAGKGHERYQLIGDQEIPLDDAEIARQWLYEWGAVSSQ